MVGKAKVFLDMLNFSVPSLLAAFEAIGRRTGVAFDEKQVDEVYGTLPSGDFSRRVLSVCTNWLAVLRLGNVGWCDLGMPERVAAAIVTAHNKAKQDENIQQGVLS